MKRCIAVAGIVLAASGCAGDHAASAAGSGEVPALEPVSLDGAWQGLMKPVAIRTGDNGFVYVADRADGKVRVYTGDGKPVRDFGGIGEGPGEFRGLNNIIADGAAVTAFDSRPTRMVRLSLTGEYQGSVDIRAFGDEMISGLGDGRLIFASSARWAGPTAGDDSPMPLARIIDTLGMSSGGIGTRIQVASPFASHILNFVVPAGTRDGSLVWLAYLNSPDVLLYRTASGTLERVSRTLPFSYKQLSDDFTPASMTQEPGKPFVPPFDAITYGVTTDNHGRAYVLTALEASTAAGGEPVKMGVDVIAPDELSVVRRFLVPGFYTHIAVSPAADRIYLLNATSGTIDVFDGPR